MKRIMLFAALAVILSSVEVNAQGKEGTQRPSTGNDGRDNRSQPGTWRTTPERRQNTDMRDAAPASIQNRQALAAGASTGSAVQDTTRPSRDTVRSPNPIPTPPVPPPPPVPRDTPRRK